MPCLSFKSDLSNVSRCMFLLVSNVTSIIFWMAFSAVMSSSKMFFIYGVLPENLILLRPGIQLTLFEWNCRGFKVF